MANRQPGHGHLSLPSSASQCLLPSQRKTFQNPVKKMKLNSPNPFVPVVDNLSRVLGAKDLDAIQQFGRVTESKNNDDFAMEEMSKSGCGYNALDRHTMVINHQPYDQKANVFSFAIVLWELVTAKVPYDTITPLQAALGVR